MYQSLVTLQQAIDLEQQGIITIIDLAPNQDNCIDPRYFENTEILRKKSPHVAINKLPQFYNAQYIVEVSRGLVDNTTNTVMWQYLHGITNRSIRDKTTTDTEYIYVLVNAQYPNLVKIGMTITTVDARVQGINATSTVHEWVAKFAVPVSKGNAYRVEQAVHKAFSDVRVSSDQGNSREFFEIDSLTAIDKIVEVGSMFMVGNVVVY